MKVLVLGAGIIGVTSAYQLARDGHEVLLADREHGPRPPLMARDAGLVCASHAAPWAAPGMRARTVNWLVQPQSPLRLGGPVDVGLIRWIMMWAGQCKAERYAINRRRMHRLARYSLHQLQALRRSLGIQYSAGCEGVLQLLHTEEEVTQLSQQFPLLDELGIPYTCLDRAGCIAVDPALAHSLTPFLGGLYLPMDETGDCTRFAAALTRHAEELGVQFRYACEAGALHIEGGRVTGIETNQGRLEADRYVVALGAGAVPWLQANGFALPVQRVKSYVYSAPLADATRAPRSGIIDERNKIWIARTGERINVVGMSELGSRRSDIRPERGRALATSLDALFPGAADLDHARLDALLQANTPDGPPILGTSPWPNLLFNIAHGFHGWTMACGAARIIADLVADRPPEIDMEGLQYTRYPYNRA
jgi:D-amino-acid dehydrogenase